MDDDDQDPRDDDDSEKRPWFGPGRYGGMHPQTWQGVLITILFVVFVVLLKSGLGRGTLVALVPIIPLILLAVFFAVTRR